MFLQTLSQVMMEPKKIVREVVNKSIILGEHQRYAPLMVFLYYAFKWLMAGYTFE